MKRLFPSFLFVRYVMLNSVFQFFYLQKFMCNLWELWLAGWLFLHRECEFSQFIFGRYHITVPATVDTEHLTAYEHVSLRDGHFFSTAAVS